MRLKPGLFAFVLLSLAACAPTVLGSSPYTPLEMSSDVLKSTKLKPGATWFVARTYSPEAFGISDETMSAYFDSSTFSKKKGEILRRGLGGYTATGFTAPGGWNVSLANVNARREIVDISSSGVRFRDSAEVILQIDVPPLATEDGLVRASVRLPNGDTVNVGFFASLDAPKPGTAAQPTPAH